ncbi:membrane protein [Gordonia phage ThankyouJordi]|uniref:Membrane protein n=1 Tax=Gordonia phage ThankyouJordi TaxID=2571252 RepID=A0A4Y6EIK3_9CAUD|nr:membrane protein [Gordonia phage ThankyouJordi]QCW22249.1 membrane protein [Gordonia phage WelcomeAyanna]QDF17825.1 membrane protein [Gordonia phage ThankyouJordi]
MTVVGILAAATLSATLGAAGYFVWWLNEKRNAHPSEHNTITGTGANT